MSSTLPPPDIGAIAGGLNPAQTAPSVASPAPNAESAKGFSAALEGYQAEAPPSPEGETGPDMASDGKDLPPPILSVGVQGVAASLGLDSRMVFAHQAQSGTPLGSTILNSASLVDGSGVAVAGTQQSLAAQTARPVPRFLNGVALASTAAAASDGEAMPNAPAQPLTQRLLAVLSPTKGAAPVLPGILPESAATQLSTPAAVTLAPVGGLLNMSIETGSPPPLPVIAQPPGIATPLNQAGWDQALANRVMWLVNNGSQTAQLQLNPPELGPLNIRISINQDQASIVFSSQHGAVREAVEAALPRLRDFLQEQGLTLAQADVTDRGLARQDEDPGRQRHGDGALEGLEADDEALWMADLGGQATRMGAGLLDIYV